MEKARKCGFMMTTSQNAVGVQAGLDAETLTMMLETIRETSAARFPDERLLQLDHEDERRLT
jgi:hypothetical protein